MSYTYYRRSIQDLKDAWINDVAEDATLSKLEKLIIFENEELMGYHPYILRASQLFPDWEKEFKETLSYNYRSQNCFFLEWHNDSADRHEIVSFSCILENSVDLIEVEEEIIEDSLITVFSTEDGSKVLKKTLREITDKLYNYAINNHVCGYEFDW